MGRCNHALQWTLRGPLSTAGGWDTLHRSSWRTDVLADCMIVCAGCQRPQQPPAVTRDSTPHRVKMVSKGLKDIVPSPSG